MTMHANSIWKYLRRSLTADSGRFAGGSAVSDPLGLLAVEHERLTAVAAAPRSSPRRPPIGDSVSAAIHIDIDTLS